MKIYLYLILELIIYEGKTIVWMKELEGEAFNFDKELVILELEKSL